MTEFIGDPWAFLDLTREIPDALQLLSAVGPVLGGLHSGSYGGWSPTHFAPPLLPQLDPIPSEIYQRLTGSGRDVVKHIQASRVLSAALQPHSPAQITRIHGDVKPDNIVPGDPVVLVDWEHSGLGSPARDIGAVLGSLLCSWVDGLAISAAGTPEEWIASGSVPLASATDTFNKFAAGYSARTGLLLTEDNELTAETLDIATQTLLSRTLSNSRWAVKLTARMRLQLSVAERVPRFFRMLCHGLG